MAGCLVYISENVCSSCQSVPSEDSDWKAYYRSGNSCHEHTHANCINYHTTSNECTTCMNGYHMDDDDHCQPNTLAKNCQEADTNNDRCDVCAKGYYKNGNFCSPHTVQNCKDFSTNADACSDCLDGYYSHGNTCLLHTAPNCGTKSTSSNTCSTCATPATHYPNGEKGCVERPTMVGCQEYLASSTGCSVCSAGYFENGNICYPNPSGIKFCTVYTSATTCTTCDSPTSSMALLALM